MTTTPGPPEPPSQLTPPGPPGSPVGREAPVQPAATAPWLPHYPRPAERYELPPASKAMAGWALGLSIINCWGIGLVLSVVFAIIVLVRGQDGRDHGKGLAIAALIINGVWLLGWLGYGVYSVVSSYEDPLQEPERDSTGQVNEYADIAPAKLRVGDCFNDPAVLGAGVEEVETQTVEVLPCENGHDLEVYYAFQVPGEDYPGRDEVFNRASVRCAGRFEGFVGRPYARSELEFYAYYPLERSWELIGDHGVTCVVGDPARRTYGTLKNSRR